MRIGRSGQRRLTATLAEASVVIAALIAVASGATPAASARTPGLAVTGYQQDSSPTQAIVRSADALTTVGVDGVNLVPSGKRVGRPTAADLSQLLVAHRQHLHATLLIGNWSDAIEDFSEPLAHRMLSDRAAIRTVAESLASDVRRQRWDGISVDLESLAPRDGAGLVRFVWALRHDLPRGRAVSVNVTNYEHAGYFPGDGYNLRGLGRAATEIVLMAYDEHGPWEQRPGPIGALAWQRAGLRIVLRAVPRRKLTLGVGGYGYVWGPHGTRTVTDAGARRLVALDHVTARFVARVGEWTATLADGATIWWSDARSYALRVRLARRLHLRGLAVWSLGESDRLRR